MSSREEVIKLTRTGKSIFKKCTHKTKLFISEKKSKSDVHFLIFHTATKLLPLGAVIFKLKLTGRAKSFFYSFFCFLKRTRKLVVI
jgi:hypothetical protein